MEHTGDHCLFLGYLYSDNFSLISYLKLEEVIKDFFTMCTVFIKMVSLIYEKNKFGDRLPLSKGHLVYKRKMPPKTKLVIRSLEEYANHSTVHGISYIFDKSIGIVERVFWLILVIGSLCMVLFMINSTYNSWQKDKVMTTLQSTTKHVSDLGFPSVTICADGLHMGLAEKVLYNNFLIWREENENETTLEEDFAQYMNDVFQIQEKGLNILDILSTLVAPESAESNEIRQTVQACLKVAKREKSEIKMTHNVKKSTSKNINYLL